MNPRPFALSAPAVLLLACGLILVPSVTARDPCADWAVPQLDFTFTVIPSETFPVTVQFNGTYTTRADEPIPSLTWDFGDGTTSTVYSADRAPGWLSPRHSYTVLRDHYTVCLEGSTICGIEGRRCRDVTAVCTAPVAGFTFDVDEGPAPLMVRVTDTSEHTPGDATTWVYLKTGSAISYERDFAGSFTQPGTFTIIQTVKKNCNPSDDSFYRAIHVHRPAEGTADVVTTAPTVAVLGVYLNFTNFTTTVPTPKATPLWLQTPYAINTSSRAASPAVTVTTATALTTPAGSQVPAAAGTYPPGTGTLSVTSDPAGAEVYVDDVLRGASPVTIPGLSAGSHTLRLERQGFGRMVVPVDIIAGRTTGYSTSLVPESRGQGMPLSAATAVVALVAGTGYWYVKNRKAP